MITMEEVSAAHEAYWQLHLAERNSTAYCHSDTLRTADAKAHWLHLLRRYESQSCNTDTTTH